MLVRLFILDCPNSINKNYAQYVFPRFPMFQKTQPIPGEERDPKRVFYGRFNIFGVRLVPVVQVYWIFNHHIRCFPSNTLLPPTVPLSRPNITASNLLTSFPLVVPTARFDIQTSRTVNSWSGEAGGDGQSRRETEREWVQGKATTIERKRSYKSWTKKMFWTGHGFCMVLFVYAVL